MPNPWTDCVDELPDRIRSEHPNYVTVEGLDLIEREIADLQGMLANAQIESNRDALSSIS